MELFLQVLSGGLVAGAMYGLIALGFTLIYNVSGVMNLAQGQFLAFAALVAETALRRANLPPALAYLAGVAAATLLAVAVEQYGLRRTERSSPASLLIATVGVSIFLEGAALLIWGPQPVHLPPLLGTEPVRIAGVALNRQSLLVAAVLAACVPATAWFYRRTLLGKAMRAVAERGTVAGIAGIDARRLSRTAFALAGALGGVAGVLTVPIISLDYKSGAILSLTGFVAAVVGGERNPIGALVGGLIIGLAQNLSAGYLSSLYSDVATFVILLTVLIVRSHRGGHTAPLHRPALRGRPILRTSPQTLAFAAGVFGLGMLALPVLVSDGYVVSLFVTIGIFSIAVVGFDVLKGFAGVASLGQAAFMGLAAYTSAWLTVRSGWAPLPALLVAVAVSAAFAALLGWSTLRLDGYAAALATLAFASIVEGVFTNLRDLTGGPSGFPGIPNFAVAGYTFSGERAHYYLVWSLVAAGALAVWRLRSSRAGRALVAVGHDEAAALALGVPVTTYKLFAFLLAAVYAAVAGSLYAHYQNFIVPSMVGMQASLTLIGMLVLGGEGRVWGGIIGVAILVLLPEVFGGLHGGVLLIRGLVLTLVMNYLPEGIAGLGARLWWGRPAVNTGGSGVEGPERAARTVGWQVGEGGFGGHGSGS